MPETFLNYINGEWAESTSGEAFPSTNPANTPDTLGFFQKSCPEDVERAVRAASAAFQGWQETPAPERGQILLKAAALIQVRFDEICRVFCREEGKTWNEVRAEVLRAVHLLQFYAGETWRITGETFPSQAPGRFLYTLRVPLGVVAAITPWNFPVAIPIWKIAPALAYGNTVVFKPAEYTPLCAVLLMQVMEEAGIPPGVVNLVTGSGQALGESLVKSPAVRGVTFTGSCEVGRSIAGWGAERGVKVQLEMGGKNSAVVLADADIEKAAAMVAQGAMWSAGQKCTATGLALVHRDVLGAFTEAFLGKVASMKVGDPLDQSAEIGPMVSESQLASVLGYVRSGLKEGAKLLAGGARLTGGEWDAGYFMAPTVFSDVDPDMRIAREEIFGPVLGIVPVGSLSEAIDIANRSNYGLSASVFTRDVSSILDYISRINVGMVHVNNPTSGAEPHVPFGGFKDSSSGYRDMGRAAMEFFTQCKTVYLDGV